MIDTPSLGHPLVQVNCQFRAVRRRRPTLYSGPPNALLTAVISAPQDQAPVINGHGCRAEATVEFEKYEWHVR